jgi:serine/threonine protein kinase
MTSTTPPFDGDLLDGRYRLGPLLGSGGVAEVYRAFDERLHRDVAIKLFRSDVADQLHRHEDEMRTLARLDHPSLVTVLDAGEDDATRRPYLVMSLVEGPTLAEELRYGALPSDRVAEIGLALADGLAYVHSQGLIHRDVKPANVLISADGRVHLADFGIARLVDASHVTNAGEVVGTPAYFAPEQVTGEPVGPPADVYSLGLVVLECLTGRREYEGTPMEVAMARISRPPAIPASLPAPWRDLLGGMTARLPNARLSASHVADRLRRISGLATESTVAMAMPPAAAPATVAMGMETAVMPPVAAGPPPTPASVAQRRPVWPWVIGILLLAAVIAAVVLVLGNNNSSGDKNGAPRGCSNLPTLNGKVGDDYNKLTDLVCTGSISHTSSRALAPYLPQLASAVKDKDVSQLDAVDSNMSQRITVLEDAGKLSPQLEQSIANALTAFYTDAKARLLKPTTSPSATESASETPSPTTSETPTETIAPTTTPTPPPSKTPKSTPTTTPSSTFTVGF